MEPGTPRLERNLCYRLVILPQAYHPYRLGTTWVPIYEHMEPDGIYVMIKTPKREVTCVGLYI